MAPSSHQPNEAPKLADPQVLTALAIQLLQPKLQAIQASEGHLSDPEYDNDFLDAMKRADAMLSIANGVSDVEVHAYQLFDEGASLMSFESIANLFKEVTRKDIRGGFPTSKNTVKSIVEKLIEAANLRINKEQMRWETIGDQVTLTELQHRAHEKFSSLVDDMNLGRLSEDFDGVIGQLVHLFASKICERAESIHGESAEERFEITSGYSTFIKHVCDGQSFEEFLSIDGATGGAPSSPRGTVSRQIRPYEIFLFAKQQGLLEDKLVVKLSDLEPGFLPNPKRKSSLPILWSHRANAI